MTTKKAQSKAGIPSNRRGQQMGDDKTNSPNKLSAAKQNTTAQRGRVLFGCAQFVWAVGFVIAHLLSAPVGGDARFALCFFRRHLALLLVRLLDSNSMI